MVGELGGIFDQLAVAFSATGAFLFVGTNHGIGGRALHRRRSGRRQVGGRRGVAWAVVADHGGRSGVVNHVTRQIFVTGRVFLQRKRLAGKIFETLSSIDGSGIQSSASFVLLASEVVLRSCISYGSSSVAVLLP